MKHNILKRVVTLLVALVMLCVCAVPAFAKGDADSDSLIERIQHDDLQGMTDDAMAHVIAFATTNNPQNLFPELSRTVIRSAPFQAIGKAYKMKQFNFKSFDGTNLKVTHFTSPKGCEWDGK